MPFTSEIAGVHPIGTFNNLDVACYPSSSFARGSNSALTVCSSEVNSVRATASSNNLDPECSKTRFASLAWHVAMAKGNFPYCGPFKPEPASILSHAELTGTSATSTSDDLGTACPPSGSTTQSRYSVSTMSNARLTSTSAINSSDNLGTAPPPSASTTLNSYSASTVSSAVFTGTAPTRSADNHGTASLPSGSARQSSYSA